MDKQVLAYIPMEVKRVMERLGNHMLDSYLIGGACRDIVNDRRKPVSQKKVITDFDIVTEATPEQIQKVFNKKSTVTCGNNFLVTLVDGIEVATYRKDKEEEAEVAHTLEEDVARRDFTINAIAYSIHSREFFDPTGGMEDLDNRILRFIGEPSRRIIEDPVRILRGVRFASQYNLTIEHESFCAMMQYRHLLNTIPSERLQQEIIKAFKTDNTFRFLTMLEEMEMLEILFPKFCKALRNQRKGGKYHNETVMNHCLFAVKAIDKTKNYRLKLGAMYHDIGKYRHMFNDKHEIIFKDHCVRGLDLIESDLKDYLKFSNDDVEYVTSMANWHMDCLDSKKTIRKLCVKLHNKNIPIKDFLLLRYADKKGNMSEYTDFRDTWRKYRECLTVLNAKPPFGVKDLDITGEEVMVLFNIPQGKEVGDKLRSAFEAVMEEKIVNCRANIINYMFTEELVQKRIQRLKDAGEY